MRNSTRAWKLFRLKKNGAITPLFIGKAAELPIGEWMDAEDIRTKGFAHRPGWHCTLTPNAPHLKEETVGEMRVWLEVTVEDYIAYDRPESQGGTWILAEKMYIDPLQPFFLSDWKDADRIMINRYNGLIKMTFG